MKQNKTEAPGFYSAFFDTAVGRQKGYAGMQFAKKHWFAPIKKLTVVHH